MRSLRKKRDLTQEQLAEYLGVSFQAVSKWETNSAYPDISLFPIIANFYGVTTDELLGVDITKAKEKQMEYIKGCQDLQSKWLLAEAVELARKGCYEFPGNLELLDNLSFWLYQSSGITKANLDEAIEISKKISEQSTDTSLRLRATARLCYCYNAKGEKDKALEYAEQLPTHSQTGTYLIARLGLMQEETQFLKGCIQMYYRALSEVIVRYIESKELSHVEKAEVLNSLLSIQKNIYGELMCDQHFEAYEFNIMIACIYLMANKNDCALDYIEKAFVHAEKYEQYEDNDVYNSVMLKDTVSYPHHHYSRSPFDDMLDHFINDSKYDAIRQDTRFIAIIKKAKEKRLNNR